MKILKAILVLILLAAELHSQVSLKRKPSFTGYSSLRYEFVRNEKTVPLSFASVLLVPVGEKILFESELEVEIKSAWTGSERRKTETRKEFTYLQVDYIAHKNLTAVAGRFLIPFGLCYEHLHRAWYEKLNVKPYTFDLVHHAGNGLMLKGRTDASDNVNLNYAAYYTFGTKAEKDRISELFESQSSFGGRVSLHIPSFRTELGASFKQTFHHYHTFYNNQKFHHDKITGVGLNFSKRFGDLYLDVLAEYFNFGSMGSAYWIETSHRFMYVPFLEPFFERSQVVARWEQFIPKEQGVEETEHVLSDRLTSRAFFGYNFYLTSDLKLSTGYGIAISSGAREKTGYFGLSWRF